MELKYLIGFIFVVCQLLFCTNITVGQTYSPIDKGSRIEFKVGEGKADAPAIKGQLSNLKGTIIFDPQHPEKGSFDVTVGSGSVNTNDKACDYKIKLPDYFGAVQYPNIRIKSNSIKQDGTGSIVYILNGTLTIKNVSKPIKMQFTCSKSGTGLLFRGMLQLNRMDYKIGTKGEMEEAVTVFLQVNAQRK